MKSNNIPAISLLIQNNELTYLKLILSRKNVDVNASATFKSNYGAQQELFIDTRLFLALRKKNLPAIQLLLSHPKSYFSENSDSNLDAHSKFTTYLQNSTPEIQAFLNQYKANPSAVKQQLYTQYWGIQHAANLFSLVVFLSDDFLTIRKNSQENYSRFFKI